MKVSQALPARQAISFALCSVAAGFPSPVDDLFDMPLDFNDLLIAHPEATFAVRVGRWQHDRGGAVSWSHCRGRSGGDRQIGEPHIEGAVCGLLADHDHAALIETDDMERVLAEVLSVEL
jgi:hypothetical protein